MGGGNSIGVGALWESLKWSLNYGGTNVADLTELKKTAWKLQANFITGNHGFGIDYIRANELKGSVSGTAGNSFNGGATGGNTWILNYNYMLSKRTSITAYYMSVTNDTNAAYTGSVFAGITTAPGADPKYFGTTLRHAF